MARELLKIEGTWEVKRYDFRDFEQRGEAVPQDLEERLNANRSLVAGSLPIGQRVQIKTLGPTAISGTLNPETLKPDLPLFEGVSFTVLPPYNPSLCGRAAWSHLCGSPEPDERDMVITEVIPWGEQGSPRKEWWPEVRPVTYTLVSVDKLLMLNLWQAKDGSILLENSVAGSGAGGQYRTVAVWLTRLGRK